MQSKLFTTTNMVQANEAQLALLMGCVTKFVGAPTLARLAPRITPAKTAIAPMM